MISYFDLHCDTLREAYLNNYNIFSSPLHISLDKTKNFDKYIQITAIWSDCRFNDHDAYILYEKILSYAKQSGLEFAKSYNDLNDKSFILSIEDARIIENDLDRINKFHDDGVRFMTLNWSGETIIGGAWDTNASLSSLGKDAVLRCFDVGIIPDISHSSRKTTEAVMELSANYNKPIIASHSNSYSVCNHNRNLTDDEFSFFVKSNSIVGISLCPSHLSNENATINDVMKHIYHYLTLNGENTISIGCDFDGVSSLPRGISGISDIPRLYNEVSSLFGDIIAKKIFFKNAYNFMKENLR